jgi:glycosyltransferase involved in cell wall biosynthesis
VTATPAVPRLTLGLPVYNGERHLAASLDALLAPTCTDFDLAISDNGSTGRTAEIARHYEAIDPRVRYIHHPQSQGSTFLVASSSSGCPTTISVPSDLLQRCIDALDFRPEIALAHSLTPFIDETGHIFHVDDYPTDYLLETDVPDPVRRFRSVLYTEGGDDFYGVMRMAVLRRVAPYDSYHWADRTLVAELALNTCNGVSQAPRWVPRLRLLACGIHRQHLRSRRHQSARPSNRRFTPGRDAEGSCVGDQGVTLRRSAQGISGLD